MKIKQQPEDFQVEELTDVQPSGEGSFALYRLEKSGWATPDALQAIRRRWRLDQRRLSVGGLKDRHARTVQYLTVYRGPERRLTHQGIHLEFLGRVPAPYTSKDIRANRFHLTVRNLGAPDVLRAEQALEEVRRDGLPNYFDDQRFGSVASNQAAGQPEPFMARLLALGRYEDSLRLALTAPYEHDRKAQKREKAILQAHWGDWEVCKTRLPRDHARGLVCYLADHPDDFRGALTRLRPDLRGLYLSAYQSHLWNRMLALWFRQHFPPEQLLSIRLRLGEAPLPCGIDEVRRRELAQLQLPLPTARLHLDTPDPRLALVESVLAEEGLELGQLKLKGSREVFFSKGDRAAWFVPAQLHCETGVDEANPSRQKLLLSFELPRGCYATLIVKRIGERGTNVPRVISSKLY